MRKKLATCAALISLGFAASVLTMPPAHAAGKLIAIITPSHDNPFFASEAAGAEARAKIPDRIGVTVVKVLEIDG